MRLPIKLIIKKGKFSKNGTRMKVEREKNISYFWSIILQEEKEFVGFVRLYSYNSKYFELSFSAMGQQFNHILIFRLPQLNFISFNV